MKDWERKRKMERERENSSFSFLQPCCQRGKWLLL